MRSVIFVSAFMISKAIIYGNFSEFDYFMISLIAVLFGIIDIKDGK